MRNKKSKKEKMKKAIYGGGLGGDGEAIYGEGLGGIPGEWWGGLR